MTAALILFVGIDYKAFGTSKRFNASGGDAPRFSSTSYPGIPNDVYQQLRASEGYRIVMDNDTGYLPNDFRHMGLATPQGFDPMMTRQLRNTIAIYEHFRSDRAFDLDPANETALKLLGVRYVITGEIGGEPSPLYQQLKGDPHYRLLGAEPTFHRVFEYLDAQPSYSWEDGGPNDLIRRRTWEPESRVFDVRTAAGGQLALHEQLFPGWTATIDGNGVSVEPWMGAFQAVTVPPGTHTVGFRYRSRLLGLGAGISMVALLGLAFWIHFEQRSPAYEAM
jgi:hypothetical protein